MPEIRKQEIDKLHAMHRFLGELLARIDGQEVVLAPEVAARVAARQKAGECLLCGQKIEGRQTRGAEISCYNKIMNRISKGEITEVEVIANGWLLSDTARAGRKSAKPDPMADFIGNSETKSPPPLTPPAAKVVNQAKTTVPRKRTKTA
jgi:hypothetical protein